MVKSVSIPLVVSIVRLWLGICITLPHLSHSFVLPAAARLRAPVRVSKLNSKRPSPARSATTTVEVDDLDLLEPDYLITDSLSLSDSERPSLSDFVASSPRELYLRLPLLLSGTALSLCNVFGYYEERIYAAVVLSCVTLGFANALADLASEDFPKNVRRGSIDGRVLQVYAGTYTASVSWLASRVYPAACPGWLPALDPVLGPLAALVFAGSLISPVLSLWSDADPENPFLERTQVVLLRVVRGGAAVEPPPPFTPTERYRAGGLVVIGIVACLYLPEAVFLAAYGAEWWDRCLEGYPGQGLLEATTAVFGLVAAQANIAITNAARFGVRPLVELVEWGVGVTFALAVVPCVCALYFLQDGITFFEHYGLRP